MDADLTSHHIEGFATHGGGHFRVPLYSHIEGNLWMGGCPVRAVPSEFKTVVSLYPWEEYDCRAHHAKFWALDAHAIDGRLFHAAANLAHAMLEAGPVLVHCQAGLNRSSVVTALVLMKLGRTPAQAIELIREKRSSACLCNLSFEQWLLKGAPL